MPDVVAELFVELEDAGLRYAGEDAERVIVALLEAVTLPEPADARDDDAGRETAPEDLLTALADLLDVLPILIPPLIVPPDVLIVVFPVL